MREEKLGGLTVRIAGGPDSQGGGDGPVVVLMHGYGAPGTDLVPLWRQLEVDRSVRFVFPEAPIDLTAAGPLAALGLSDARAWWSLDIAALQQDVLDGKLDQLTQRVPDGLLEARSAIQSLLSELERELSARHDQIVIGGFSQGAMLATDVALSSTQRLAGLVILSGSLINREQWISALSEHVDLPVFQSHGRMDPVLPYALAEQLHAAFKNAGLVSELVAFSGGHGIGGSVLEQLSQFLRRLFAPPLQNE